MRASPVVLAAACYISTVVAQLLPATDIPALLSALGPAAAGIQANSAAFASTLKSNLEAGATPTWFPGLPDYVKADLSSLLSITPAAASVSSALSSAAASVSSEVSSAIASISSSGDAAVSSASASVSSKVASASSAAGSAASSVSTQSNAAPKATNAVIAGIAGVAGIAAVLAL